VVKLLLCPLPCYLPYALHPVTRLPVSVLGPVLCWLAFPSAPALGSTDSAADRSALFTGFTATTAGSDFSRRASSATAPHLPDAEPGGQRAIGRNVRPPGSDVSFCAGCVSSTTAERQSLARGTAHVAFDVAYRSASAVMAFAAQWHTPHNRCVRFAPASLGDHATLATGRPLRLPDRSLTGRTHASFLAHNQSHLLRQRHGLLRCARNDDSTN